ncbi:hypothetical protein fugu_007957 [Takifugu bimaculatus]|uniref:PBZ-type domain-containing protein n=1 Tax=Takifugu bimaculatus TaxID=433685 RepID=A0A4Z2B1Y6_9TELE|nr:hypothetical protein fugu_007957 [Takifugu bimaculatus]
MSGFDLVPVGGGEPIRLPPGETVIGRGPLLRVADKRVSRHHGLLENIDGCLRLKPALYLCYGDLQTHMNPCFIQSSLTDDPRPLQKDSWFSLQDGDLFSLLPGQLIYRVVTVCDGDSSRYLNSQRVEEKLPLSPKPDVEPLSAPRCAETPPPEEPTEAPPPQHHQVSPVQTVNKVCPANSVPHSCQENMMSTEVTPKRRMLPAWMMAAVTAPHGSPSFSSKDQRATTSSKRQTAAKKPKMTSAEEEQEEHSEEDKPKKKRNVQGYEEQWDVPVVPLSSTADLSDESDSFSVEAQEEERQGPNTSLTTGKLAVAQLEDRKFKKTTIANSKICSPSSPLSTPRMPCPYGKECYRKNPVHFQESSHPGDADYKEEEPEDVERPECPYGTDCYRKNPLHRKEYKHTKKPAYNTRPRLKAAAEEDGVEDSDDDDSFINDDSEDGGDDSDYVPPDSDDSGKEDIRRLQREAQAFLKKGK